VKDGGNGAMKIHIRDGDIHLHDTRTRLPFKYGIATMTSAPHLFLRLHVEVDGKQATGIAADGLAPKWFTKDPNRSIEEESHEMVRVIENALRLAIGTQADSVLRTFRLAERAQWRWGLDQKLPALLTQFGSSLVERALIEAVCRAVGRPFGAALRDNLFGIPPGSRPTPWPGSPAVGFLPERPLERVWVRHTVGLADPLEDADIPPAERLDDGLPQSLEASIRAYGLRHFKIKLTSNKQDVDRLRKIAAVIETCAGTDYAFSLDGNEKFLSLPGFQTYWADLTAHADLRPFFQHLLFVEQPFNRVVALRTGAVRGLKDWQERPPIIIDESDDQVHSMAWALELGYAGASHKNCKGVFKGFFHAKWLAPLRHQQADRPWILSGEDLCSIGPVAMVQDLNVCANLGIASVERNGHHYFAGLSMWPEDVQNQVLQHHGDLYHRGRDGWPTLNIRDGRVEVGSLLRAPFGVGFEMPVERFLTPDEWRRAYPLAQETP
jgi:hypothetical protein